MVGRFIILSFVAALATLVAATPSGAAGKASPPSNLDPRAQQLLQGACEDLASARAFTFHVEINFDQVLPSNVKLQFAAAADYSVQRPDQLAVDFHSDLGAKKIWYSGDHITLFDPPHLVYATTEVPSTIDGMMEQLEAVNNLSIPMADLAYSHPCDPLRKGVIYSAYIGVNDVNGEDCDHVAFAKKNVDWQIWLQRTGKHLPLKIVINYRNAPGSPEYTGVLSDWKFPASIPASVFQPVLPKDAKRIDFKKVKEPKP